MTTLTVEELQLALVRARWVPPYRRLRLRVTRNRRTRTPCAE